jgi:hypothetical protein
LRSGEFTRVIRTSIAVIISLLRPDEPAAQWESKYGALDWEETMIFHRDGDAICLSRFEAGEPSGVGRNETVVLRLFRKGAATRWGHCLNG